MRHKRSKLIYSNTVKPGPLGQVRDNPPEADRNRMPWGTGMVEYWNTGFGGRRYILIKMTLIRN